MISRPPTQSRVPWLTVCPGTGSAERVGVVTCVPITKCRLWIPSALRASVPEENVLHRRRGCLHAQHERGFGVHSRRSRTWFSGQGVGSTQLMFLFSLFSVSTPPSLAVPHGPDHASPLLMFSSLETTFEEFAVWREVGMRMTYLPPPCITYWKANEWWGKRKGELVLLWGCGVTSNSHGKMMFGAEKQEMT